MYQYKAIRVDGKKVDEHRYLMEQKLGRKLSFNEVVHHDDDNKRNNEPPNLILKSRSDHSRDHILKGDIGWQSSGNKLPQKHPSTKSYKRGCRCEECKEIQRKRVAAWRNSKNQSLKTTHMNSNYAGPKGTNDEDDDLESDDE